MVYRGIIFEECKILGDRQILNGLRATLLEDVEITRSQIFDCGLLWVERLCWDGSGWHWFIFERITLSLIIFIIFKIFLNISKFHSVFLLA